LCIIRVYMCVYHYSVHMCVQLECTPICIITVNICVFDYSVHVCVQLQCTWVCTITAEYNNYNKHVTHFNATTYFNGINYVYNCQTPNYIQRYLFRLFFNLICKDCID